MTKYCVLYHIYQCYHQTLEAQIRVTIVEFQNCKLLLKFKSSLEWIFIPISYISRNDLQTFSQCYSNQKDNKLCTRYLILFIITCPTVDIFFSVAGLWSRWTCIFLRPRRLNPVKAGVLFHCYHKVYHVLKGCAEMTWRILTPRSHWLVDTLRHLTIFANQIRLKALRIKMFVSHCRLCLGCGRFSPLSVCNVWDCALSSDTFLSWW